MIKKGDVIGYENKGEFRSIVLEDVLKMFAEKTIVELIKFPSKCKCNKIAIASTTDLEADKIIHFLIRQRENPLTTSSKRGQSKGKEKLTSPKEGKIIKPLYLFLDKEVLLYAKLRDLKFGKEVNEKDKISLFIDELEIKHPEVKQAVVSSLLGR